MPIQVSALPHSSRWHPVAVEFEHDIAGRATALSQFFRAPVIGNRPANLLLISRRDMEQPLRSRFAPEAGDIAPILERHLRELLGPPAETPQTCVERVGALVARRVGRAEVTIDVIAGAVIVDVRGLKPGHRYFYRFLAGGEASPIGRTRTTPAGAADAVSSVFRMTILHRLDNDGCNGGGIVEGHDPFQFISKVRPMFGQTAVEQEEAALRGAVQASAEGGAGLDDAEIRAGKSGTEGLRERLLALRAKGPSAAIPRHSPVEG